MAKLWAVANRRIGMLVLTRKVGDEIVIADDWGNTICS